MDEPINEPISLGELSLRVTCYRDGRKTSNQVESDFTWQEMAFALAEIDRVRHELGRMKVEQAEIDAELIKIRNTLDQCGEIAQEMEKALKPHRKLN